MGLSLASLHISKRQFSSYILDWIAIFAFAGIGGGLSQLNPNYHAFSVLDLSISYPQNSDTVSTAVLFVACLVVPAVIIFGVCLLFVPGPSGWKQMPHSAIWRRKFWEWNIGWLGLGLSLATAFLITQGAKNIFGKPRPDALATCNPDLSRLAQYTVGGYGQDISNRWVLVDYHICQQSDADKLKDAFRSFPSGHSSASWSGLLYFSLWLCSKFGVVFPTRPLPISSWASGNNQTGNSAVHDTNRSGKPFSASPQNPSLHHREAASPPTWALYLPYIPIGAAIYISGSRYFDYKHHGFDILFGALIGIFTSLVSYRYYHLPLESTSAGWGWAPRSPSRAFAIGVGTSGYVEQQSGWSMLSNQRDLELGAVDGENRLD